MNRFVRISLLFFILLSGTFSSLFAQEKHEVKKGETLFSISQEYGVEVKSIQKANDLPDKNIEPGQKLKIPAAKESGTEDTVVHVVKEGETLYSICQEYRADIDKVLQLNPKASKEIKVGQKLRIPVGTASSDQGKQGRFPFDSTKAGYHYHLVEKGETLFSLSQRYNTSIDSIEAHNPHIDEEGLEVGQLIRILKGEQKEEKSSDPLALPDSLTRKGYRIHKVKKGETFYSIARRNGITLEHLMEENPHISEELLKGQAIRIPRKDGERAPRSHEDTLLLHEVQEGETVRSIATMYGTDPAYIILANELFFTEIEEGDFLLIPIPPRAPDSIPSDTEMKGKYRIGLILPLYLTENDSILKNPSGEEKPELYSSSSYALEFYEGFRMAADSVTDQLGTSLDIEVLSSRKGMKDLKAQLQEAEFRNCDLIVGPFYRSNMDQVVDFMKESDIHHVCPVRHSNKVLLDRPDISKALPSSSTLIKALAEHTAKKHGHKNVLLLDHESVKDDKRIDVFRERFDRLLPTIDSTYRDSVRTLHLKKDGDSSLKKHLKEDTSNILIAPTKEKAFASRLMNRLSTLNEDLGENKSYPIKIYGSEEWKNFQTVDIKYKERFKLHIITSQHIQHDSIETERFYRDYRKSNNTDPTKYGFMGYDIGNYYLRALSRFGTGFSSSFDQVQAPTLHLDFEFFRTGVSSGYENQHAYIIRYTKDHRIERMKTR